MNHHYNPDEADRVAQARESFSGRLLTDSQFDEAMSITGIIEAEIRKSGVFRDKLSDYAHAFARTERFDAMRAESTLRDLFKARTGQTMNALREDLLDRESALDGAETEQAKAVTREIGTLIKDGDKMPFHRAYEYQAGVLAEDLGITNAGAKRIMTEVFREEAGSELYDWGKDLEEKHYRPQIEAEKQEREERAQSRSSSRSSSRSRSTGSGSSKSSSTRTPRCKQAMAGPSR
ncbi:MAG: hypothetical protein AAFQ10_00135 [Pseudomonadota bacterium]